MTTTARGSRTCRCRLHEDLLQLHQPPHLRHGGPRRGARVRPAGAGRGARIAGPCAAIRAGTTSRPASSGSSRISGSASRIGMPARDTRFMAAEIVEYTKRLGLGTGGFYRFEFIDSHFFQGARAYLVGAQGARAYLGGIIHEAAPDRGGVREYRARHPRRRGAARGVAGQQRIQLHALLLLHRPDLGHRRGAVPAFHSAPEADRRALHRARTPAPGQDRALPMFFRSPAPERRPVRPMRRAMSAS